MKLGDAAHALALALKDYAPRPEVAVGVIRNHFRYKTRVYYGGNWITLDNLMYLVPRYKSAEEIKLTFFGGPPNKRKYVTGSLVDFVQEVCMWELSIGDPHRRVYDFVHGRLMEQYELANAI